MAGDVVIRAEGLGKKYMIGHLGERERYVALRDVIARNARNLWRTTVDLATGRPNVAGDEVEEFWALRDVSFEIGRGEVVGVIGRNGAGKSTLLKILSRITEPTEGRVEIRGRVASLLEVGTGFHPELSGRENVYLNGAVLGMTHAEIRRKFDEIVAFAEVERFLDTPVKRFSSGMYVRLAFAVAAHLEPEIIIIDEVLAVGDAEFQKKCLGKMGDVAGQGRTVIFVSHNMAAIVSLCRSGILLDSGRVTAKGPIDSVVARYASLAHPTGALLDHGKLFQRDPRAPMREAAILAVEMLDSIGAPAVSVESCGSVTFRAIVTATAVTEAISVFFIISSPEGATLAQFETNPRTTPLPVDSANFAVDCQIGVLPLSPGEYTLSVGVAYFATRSIEFNEHVGRFSVSYSSEKSVQMSPHSKGHVAMPHVWRVGQGSSKVSAPLEEVRRRALMDPTL